MRLLFLAILAMPLAGCGGDQSAYNAGFENAAADETDGNAADSAIVEEPKIWCEVIEERVTEEECQDFQALKDEVRPSPSAVDVPEPMVRDRAYTVTLVIDRSLPPQPPEPLPTGEGNGLATENAVDSMGENAMDAGVADNAVTENASEPADLPPTANEVVAGLPGSDHPFQAKVGRYMSADLIGSGFAIRRLSPSDPLQEIPRGDQGQWKWEVIPQKGGRLELTVNTQAFGVVNGKRKPLGGASTTKSVEVDVSWGDWFRDLLGSIPGMIGLVTAIVVALGALVAAALKLRRDWRHRDKE